MKAFLIVALVIALLALVFALQNTTAVDVRFLFWEFHGSLALVLLLTLILGALIAFLALAPSLLRRRRRSLSIGSSPPQPRPTEGAGTKRGP